MLGPATGAQDAGDGSIVVAEGSDFGVDGRVSGGDGRDETALRVASSSDPVRSGTPAPPDAEDISDKPFANESKTPTLLDAISGNYVPQFVIRREDDFRNHRRW